MISARLVRKLADLDEYGPIVTHWSSTTFGCLSMLSILWTTSLSATGKYILMSKTDLVCNVCHNGIRNVQLGVTYYILVIPDVSADALCGACAEHFLHNNIVEQGRISKWRIVLNPQYVALYELFGPKVLQYVETK
jgi:uncharacterized MnhB-related membrane protein